MIDPFVLLTPLLLLGIVALLGFVGCNWIFGLEPTKLSQPPKPSSISPISGTPQGGTSVTITGAQFEATPTVTFGGTAATNVQYSSDAQITADTPAHSPGAVDVVVTNPDGETGVLPAGFTFTQVTLAQPPQTKQQPGNPPISVTLPGTQAGSLILVTVSWGVAGTISISDGNNTYKNAGTGNWSGQQAQMFYAMNVTSGSLTITASGGGATGPCSLCATEYLDVDPANPLYSFAAKGTPSVGGSLNVMVTSNLAGDLIYGVAFAQNGNLGVGSGFTKETGVSLGTISLLVADEVVTTAGATPVGITNSVATSPWVILATAIKHG